MKEISGRHALPDMTFFQPGPRQEIFEWYRVVGLRMNPCADLRSGFTTGQEG